MAIVLLVLAFTAGYAGAQTAQPLNFENNFLVTGDYVVAGVGLRGAGAGGYATGTITMPDANSVPRAGVPAGADIVGAFLYWQTVESSGTYAGQHGFFRALGYGAPAGGYPIWATVLGNLNAPVSWSAGGCSGSSQGSKTIVTYRADVRAYLPTDANGILRVGNSANPVQYEVRLADSGSNGGSVPLTLGASLVIIYRVASPAAPLKYVVLYDGSYSPSNGAQTMSQSIGGFYQAGHDANPNGSVPTPEVKITHIVGNGQTNKYQSVTLGGASLTSLYSLNGTVLPPFPGYYNSTGATFNGSWDNPTWLANNYGSAVAANDSVATTQVAPSGSSAGCVSWGAVVLSTTVQDTDHDGLLDAWEDNQGYTDFATNQAVSLPNACSGDANQPASCAARPTTKDIYWQIDSMCGGTINADGSCTATATGDSHTPDPSIISAITGVFGTHGITLHPPVIGASIPESPACFGVDAKGNLCGSIGVPGVVAWKAGFEVLKNQPLNINTDGTVWTEAQCEANPSACVRRFQSGKKDSYHEVLLAHGQVLPRWSFADGTLTSVNVASGGLATFYTSTPPDLAVGDTTGKDRVTVVGALVNAGWVGTFLVQSVNTSTVPYSFTIQTTLPAGTYTKSSEPSLSIYSGRVGTASGFSDVGGSDSMITLGTWADDGKPPSVQEGTIMHEFGHSLGLTHGGSYLDTNGSFVRTFGANCKPNFQSIMNYLFQVDLLDDGVLNYSEESLGAIDETTGFAGFTSSFVQNTTWYTSTPPDSIGTPATHYCDGTPLPTLNPPTMYRVSGPTTSLSWSGAQDINFDGKSTAIAPPASFGLRGYSDWDNLDLRQIGATGSLSVASGINLSGGSGINLSGGSGINLSGGSGINLSGGSGINLSGGSGINLSGGSGINLSGGSGVGELDRTVANSTVRPPRHLTETPTDTRLGQHSVALSWSAPTFGQIAAYDVYRSGGDSTGWPHQPAPIATTTGYTDGSVAECTAYSYFVTSLLALQPGDTTNRQSVPTGSVPYAVPCKPENLLLSQTVANNQGVVTVAWQTPSTPSAPILGYNVYRVVGTDTTTMTLLASVVSGASYTDSTVANNTTYTYAVTTVPVDETGCGQAPCRESTQVTQTIAVAFKIAQTITFNPNPLPNKTYGDSDFAVTATSDSGLPVSFAASPAANCTVTAATVHIVHAGPCTITASQAGDASYYPAPNVERPFTINKANPTVAVIGYSVTYDGNPHTATGTAKGVFDEALAGLDLSTTIHTSAGTYSDTWYFTDVTGNYNNASAVVGDTILKANPVIVVVPYTVNYDGFAHSATGSATGVKGESLAGLNLVGTVHTAPAIYANDPWVFTDVTGNYNNAGGTVTDTIIKGNSLTKITSVTPASPSILGNSLTVNVSVAPVSGATGTPTGSVTVTDAFGGSCTANLTGGTGSCVLTPPVLVNGKTAVGTHTLTANYAGDGNFNTSTGSYSQQVVYNFVGFLSPLKLQAYSGSFNLGKAIPIKWQLTTSSGSIITMSNIDLTKVSLKAVYTGQPVNGSCAVSTSGGILLVLWTSQTGMTGNSSFRYDTTNNQFVFNWDTSVNDGAGCYTLAVQLDDAVNGKPVWTTSLQLK